MVAIEAALRWDGCPAGASANCLALAGGTCLCIAACAACAVRRRAPASEVSTGAALGATAAGLYLHLATGGALLSRFLVSSGLFGFACGVVCWLALRMLLREMRAPSFRGSRVVLGQSVATGACNRLKDAIMEMCFNENYLEEYVQSNGGRLERETILQKNIEEIVSSPKFEAAFEAKLGSSLIHDIELFGGTRQMLTMILPIITAIAEEMVPSLIDTTRTAGFSSVHALRIQVDTIMTEKLEELTSKTINELVEPVVREHLGWLVLWGNILGSLFGFTVQLVEVVLVS